MPNIPELPRPDLVMSALVETLVAQPEAVIPIIGRQLSMIETGPGEPEVTIEQHLCAKLWELARKPQTPPPTKMDDLVARLSIEGVTDDLLYPHICVLLKEADLPTPPALKDLAAISSINLFVTTAYDDFLERAIADVRFEGDRSKVLSLSYNQTASNDIPDVSAANGRPIVYHLFGKITPRRDDYALTEEDVLEFMTSLQSKDRQPPVLFERLRQKQLLLIGNQFEDWLIRFFLRTVSSDRLSRAKTLHFLAEEEITSCPGFAHLVQHFWKRTKFVENSSPLYFPGHLRKMWELRVAKDSKPKVAKASEPGKFKGPVFLSYASEDVDMAERVYEVLTKQNVRVWFDRSRLEGGMNFEAEIKRKIDESDLFLPLISKHTTSKGFRFFKKEWSWALEKIQGYSESETFVVPVAIDETSPTADLLPAQFRQLHWLRLEGGGADEDRMSSYITKILR